MKFDLFVIVCALIAGTLFCVSIGCRTPVARYTIKTTTPDIWAEKPKQTVEFNMEFTR